MPRRGLGSPFRTEGVHVVFNSPPLSEEQERSAQDSLKGRGLREVIKISARRKTPRNQSHYSGRYLFPEGG